MPFHLEKRRPGRIVHIEDITRSRIVGGETLLPCSLRALVHDIAPLGIVLAKPSAGLVHEDGVYVRRVVDIDVLAQDLAHTPVADAAYVDRIVHAHGLLHAKLSTDLAQHPHPVTGIRVHIGVARSEQPCAFER